MNENLLKVFSEDEITVTLKQMNPTKAPGPDGMTPIFFQKLWHVVGKDVTEAVLKALNSGQFLAEVNHTYITLIPKKKQLELIYDFRPISLCNVIYKLI